MSSEIYVNNCFFLLLFQQKVIDSENVRLKKFTDGASGNDVWEYRKTPAPHWNKRLPDWWYEKVEGTFLKRHMDSETEADKQ